MNAEKRIVFSVGLSHDGDVGCVSWKDRSGRGCAYDGRAENTYLKNGHNYQNEWLRLYLSGNGGVLMGVAMMAAGWDGAPRQTCSRLPRKRMDSQVGRFAHDAVVNDNEQISINQIEVMGFNEQL